MREQTIWLAGKRHVLQQHSTMMKPAGAHTSPYLEFYREQRPLLPADLSNADREKAVSHRWKALSMAERAVYAQGLTQALVVKLCVFFFASRKRAPRGPLRGAR